MHFKRNPDKQKKNDQFLKSVKQENGPFYEPSHFGQQVDINPI